MDREYLPSRPLYSIGTVARLTGIKPGTLRIWDRRYGLGASQKSDSGRRLYSQTDLEHLQIIARLVRQGFRIGDIASRDRKTLAALLEQAGGAPPASTTERVRVLFLGQGLSNWLGTHPGCMNGFDARTWHGSIESALSTGEFDELRVDALVASCGAVGMSEVETLKELARRVQARCSLVFYEFSNGYWLRELAGHNILSAKLPLETESFSIQMKRVRATLDVLHGSRDAGDLVAPRPRLYDEAALVRYKHAPSGLACGCSHHLTDIIQSLVNFETYSASCAVEGWQDAATHACVYAYTNQARWLMEKALLAVDEELAASQGREAAGGESAAGSAGPDGGQATGKPLPEVGR